MRSPLLPANLRFAEYLAQEPITPFFNEFPHRRTQSTSLAKFLELIHCLATPLCVAFCGAILPVSTSLHLIRHLRQSAKGSRTSTVSSRSGLVESNATGHSTSSSIRLTYLIACAGKSAHDRAPAVLSLHPSTVS